MTTTGIGSEFRASGGCVIISIDGLQRRRFKKVNWSKLMPEAPESRSSLSMLRSPGNKLDLVLTRNYGAIIAIILDENSDAQSALMRIPSKHYDEFLELYFDDVLIPDLAAQYDIIQLYLVEHNHGHLGPLTSARAALLIKNHDLPTGLAIERAQQQGVKLAEENAERLQQVNALVRTG